VDRVATSLGTMSTFDWGGEDEDAILDRARGLIGLTLGEIAGASFAAVEGKRGKAEVGHAVESWFDIPRNSRSEADFPGAGIELKAVPVRLAGSSSRVKERTFLSMIDYGRLVEETWQTASVRKKLKILFVFYQDIADAPKATYPILAIDLFEPDQRIDGLLRTDWERIQRIVRHGHAHLLSERDGRLMTPSTKGTSSRVLKPQPFNTIGARSRAFALKPSFTLERYRSITSRPATSTLADELGIPTVDRFEEELLRRFQPYMGRRLGDVATELGVPLTSSKHFAALVVRRVLGMHQRTRIAELEEAGLSVRMTRVDDDSRPYEALSFPAFRYRDLLEETWEDSDLLQRIEYLLLVPVHGRRKETPAADCRLVRPIFWRPSMGDLELIRAEWELYRLEIERGRAERLTPSSETVAIHVRPHARNKADTDDAPIVGPVVKKSFWLNQRFVQSILRGDR
jgi:DNA mismatch repair endonuclease MutH